MRFGDQFKKDLISNKLTDNKNRWVLRLKNIKRL